MLRTGGITANFENDIHWRWSKTPEEQLLAQGGEEPAAIPVHSGALTEQTGPVFEAQLVTVSCAQQRSKLTGQRPRRSKSGAGRLAPAGLHLQ